MAWAAWAVAARVAAVRTAAAATAAATPADANRPDANRQRPPGRGPTPEAQELMTTLQNDNASTNDIKTKLQALREQRKKSEAELAQSAR